MCLIALVTNEAAIATTPLEKYWNDVCLSNSSSESSELILRSLFRTVFHAFHRLHAD